MIRGIRFEIPNKHGKYLNEIFKNIDLFQYQWNLQYVDVYLGENGGIRNVDSFDEHITLPEEGWHNGQKFQKMISENDYYLVFLELFAYPLKSKATEIRGYEDYAKSDCQLILLCYDVAYYDFYAKNNKIIEQVRKNCIQNGYENIKYITDDNDTRYRMSV